MISDGELLYSLPNRATGFWPKFVQTFRPHRKLSQFSQFTILPNVNGQKYTIGSKFISRDAQGEFILLPEPILQSVEETHLSFEINVQNNKYFVSSGQGPRSTPLFVNDSKVVTNKVLRFGSKLSFGDQKHTFLFHKVQTRKRKDSVPLRNKIFREHRPKPDFTPLQNELILSHILSYLPLYSLKSCRFVSHLWNAEARKLLRTRCWLTLSYDLNYNNPKESLKLFRYSLEMESMPLLNWKIVTPPFKYSHHCILNSKRMADLSTFLSRSHTITQLVLEGSADFSQEYKLRLKILGALSPTLESLELAGRLGPGWEEDSDIFVLSFPRLTTLTLALEHDRWADSPEDYAWFRDMIPRLTGVSRIVLSCHAEVSLVLLECLNSFHNLTNITVYSICPDGVRSLLQLPQRLKTLELWNLVDMGVEDYLLFEELLQKHAQTLESLQFVINPKLESDLRNLVVQIPPFPKLVRLGIGWDVGRVIEGDCVNRERYVLNTENCSEITFSFPDGGINYAKDFPVLQSLTLWPLGFGRFPLDFSRELEVDSVAELWEQIHPFYAMFIPSLGPDFGGECERVRSVQEFDVLAQVPWTRTLHGHYTEPLFSQNALTRIGAMFPNLRHKNWDKRPPMQFLLL